MTTQRRPTPRSSPPPIPAALRPKPAKAAKAKPTLHLTFVVPDPRLHEILKRACYFVGPQFEPYRIRVHTVVADPAHRTADLPHQIKHSLLELGLVNPDDVAYGPVDWVQKGWAQEDVEETA